MATLLYFAAILQKTSKSLFMVKKKRIAVAIDETKVKLEALNGGAYGLAFTIWRC